jgi:hypothetical protein
MGLSLRAQAVLREQIRQRTEQRAAEQRQHEAERAAFEHEYLTREQAAEVLGCRPSTLKHWYAEGRGPATVKFGESRQARVRYPRTELLAFAENPTAYQRPARECGRFDPPKRKGGRQHGR